jgi:hypothetical protein
VLLRSFDRLQRRSVEKSSIAPARRVRKAARLALTDFKVWFWGQELGAKLMKHGHGVFERLLEVVSILHDPPIKANFHHHPRLWLQDQASRNLTNARTSSFRMIDKSGRAFFGPGGSAFNSQMLFSSMLHADPHAPARP